MKYLKLFTNFLQTLGELQDDEVGRLFRAMLKYAEDGSEPVLQGNERFVWGAAALHMDMASQFSERKRSAGSIGGSKQTQASTSNDKQVQASASNPKLKEKKRKEYKEILSNESTKKVPVSKNPPTVEEVKAYCSEAGISIDAESFLDYYKSTGWKTSGGTPLYDWMSAARNWARRDRRSFKPPDKNYTPSAYRNADLERLEVDLNARP